MTTVFFPEPTSEEIPYAKAIIDTRKVDYFTDMGAVLDPADLKPKKVAKKKATKKKR